MQDGKAQIVLYNQKGYINDECVEIAEAETQGEWTIKCFLGNYSVWKGEEQVLFDLVEASFFSPTVIKLKKKNVRYYNLYSLQMESELSSSYIDISDLSDGQAIAVNINKLSGTIDTNGIEIYDEESSLSDNILVKRKFSRYDIFVDQNEVISGVLEVSLWATNRLKVKNEYSKYQIYSIEDNTYIGESFSNIYDIQEGKAKVLRNGSTAYIDINANILPEMSLSIGNNLIKKKIFGYWNLVDNNNNSIIEGEYREIGTYKGRFIKFDGSDFCVLDKKYTKPIPVIGTFYRQYTSTLIYLVGGHYVRIQIKNLELNGKSVTEYTKEHSTLKLIINYINFKKQAVYGVPYKEMNPKTFVPFEDNQEIEGKIYKVLPFGIRIKFQDGRRTLIHKNRLAEIGYQDVLFTIGQSITIVKKGYDDEHKADIWDIIQIK
ncbi:MAG: hypothetical protein IKQ72_09030 [Bacteroidaceae bacterium]|nr:hypothetical protein [Bacteroidaceae bacterium]